jgi:hypothetical protein
MIVLDEEIQGPRIGGPIAEWYSGKVISVKELRANSLIKDDSIPTLLHQVARPTFVTINVVHFWRVIQPSRAYAVVCIELPLSQIRDVSVWLRRYLAKPDFKTKARRMGTVALLRPTRIEYYRLDRKIETLHWE